MLITDRELRKSAQISVVLFCALVLIVEENNIFRTLLRDWFSEELSMFFFPLKRKDTTLIKTKAGNVWLYFNEVNRKLHFSKRGDMN